MEAPMRCHKTCITSQKYQRSKRHKWVPHVTSAALWRINKKRFLGNFFQSFYFGWILAYRRHDLPSKWHWWRNVFSYPTVFCTVISTNSSLFSLLWRSGNKMLSLVYHIKVICGNILRRSSAIDILYELWKWFYR